MSVHQENAAIKVEVIEPEQMNTLWWEKITSKEKGATPLIHPTLWEKNEHKSDWHDVRKRSNWLQRSKGDKDYQKFAEHTYENASTSYTWESKSLKYCNGGLKYA